MVEQKEVEAVIKALADLSERERQLIIDLPDHIRRMVLHFGTLSELVSLIRKSIGLQQWYSLTKVMALLRKLLQEVDLKQGIITPLVYEQTEFSQVQKIFEDTRSSEEKVTFAFYDRLNKLIRSQRQDLKTVEKTKIIIDRLQQAMRQEKITQSIDEHLDALINTFRNTLNLFREHLAHEQDLLDQLEKLVSKPLGHDVVIILKELYTQLQQELLYGRQLQVRLVDGFYKPFKKFTDHQLEAEDVIGSILSHREKWYHLWRLQPTISRKDFVLDYYTMTNPEDVLLYIEVLDALGPRYVSKDLQNFIRNNRRRLIARVQSQKYALTHKLAVMGRDPLTGVPGKGALKEKLSELISTSSRTHLPFSVFMLDIDYFKSINDQYGHPVGDSVLQNVALAMKSALRKSDFLARYGGEEFTVLLPNTNKAQALAVAEKIRLAVPAANQEPKNPRTNGPITISIGVATYPQDASNSNQLIAIADKALYKAKQSGRNTAIAA